METNVRFDHEFLSIESEHAVHCMLELAVPDTTDEQRAPIHVALVIDRSGSMYGPKLEVAKQCAQYLTRRLAPTDELAIVTYDERVDLVSGLAPVDATATTHAIAGIYPGGSTNLSGGWLKGLEELRRTKSRKKQAEVRRVVLLTDGLANVGIVDHDQLVGIAAGTKAEAATTTIGFGEGFDEDLLTAIADASGGATYFAENPDDAPAIFAEEFDGLTKLVAQNVSVEICPSDEVELIAVLNEYPMTAAQGGVQIQIGDAYGGERRRLVFELRIPQLAQLGPANVASVVLRYVTIGDAIAAHETTIPIIVNLVSADEAAVAELDHEVVDEVVVLQAARAKKEAIRLADEGRYDDARKTLQSAAEDLRKLAPSSPRAAELTDEALRLEGHSAAMSASDYSPLDRKRMSSESWRRSRGRRS
jgi:Ca-activated chloride channel family protein